MAERLIARLIAQGKTLATAESLTGGMLGAQITAVSGCSAVYRGGVVSYCDEIKHRVLGVEQELLATLGAVSEPVARQMARGARRLLGADYALSTTGIAGPDSDGSGKPVGLVYIGLSTPQGDFVRELHLSGDRGQIRTQTCRAAIALALEHLK